MSSFRWEDSAMASGHGLTNRKVLLPFEAELCNTLGISKEEYFEYLERAELTPVRGEEYALVPDVQNEASLTIAIISLVLGVASTAASLLLAPKPSQKRPEAINIQKGDQIGQNRFTPTSNFGSIQDLARLGQIVPLIFADRNDDADYGGTRANGLLTNVMLSSTRSGQRIRAILATSLAPLDGIPDFKGIAIGDQLLNDYSAYRLMAYARAQDGLINRSNLYDESKLDIDESYEVTKSVWHPNDVGSSLLSGARTPSNKTAFGAYAPMPNGNFWKLDFQMFILPDAAADSESGRIRSMRSKIESKFPIFAAVTKIQGDIVTYSLDTRNKLSEFKKYYDVNKGVQPDDIRTQINEQRRFIDENIIEGETYIFGNRLAVCIERPDERFEPDSSDAPPVLTYKFRYTKDERNDYDGAQVVDKRAVTDTIPHWEQGEYSIQRFADAVITNNQVCECTEIGIGSTVWSRIAGANINNFPGDDAITEMENNDAGGTFDMGRMDLYLPRYSFFHIQVKPDGFKDWVDTDPLFAVLGRSTEEQYNAIRIYHPRGQHSYRLRPYPSSLAFRRNIVGKKVILLDARRGLDISRERDNVNRIELYTSTNGIFRAYFEGAEFIFSEGAARNAACFKGSSDPVLGQVTKLDITSTEPSEAAWQTDEISYKGPPPKIENDPLRTYARVNHDTNKGVKNVKYFYEGNDRGGMTYDESVDVPNDKFRRKADSAYSRTFADGKYRYIGTSTLRYHENKDPQGYIRDWYEIRREIRVIGEPDGEPVVNEVIAVSTEGTGLSVRIQKYTDGSYTWEIADSGSGYKTGDKVKIPLAEVQPNPTVTVTAKTDPVVFQDDPGWWGSGDMYPYHAVSDYRCRDTEDKSNISGPEHRITYVNEIQQNPNDTTNASYEHIASMALIINSSKELNNLDQVSSYYKKGIEIKKLGSGQSGEAASNIFPEIAYFLLTNRVTGAGAVIDENQIDIDSFHRAADYCRKNGFYWDGVIDERVNLREFLFEQASYCLLDFTMKGGRFGLEPSVPVNSQQEILYDSQAKPEIKALFTDGNIKDMQVTTLTPEDRKLFEAEVLWRKEIQNKFPENQALNARLQGYDAVQAFETFDLTKFCTSEAHATKFAKFALKVRKWIDHTIEFQTTPESAAGIGPGDYVRVVSHVCHPSRFENGCVTADGHVVSSRPIPSGTNVYYWRAGFTLNSSTNSYIKTGSLTYDDNGIADAAFRGCVFSVINDTSTDRVYKVDTISIGEEGFVQITGSHMPLTDSGALQIMQNWIDDDDFVINNG